MGIFKTVRIKNFKFNYIYIMNRHPESFQIVHKCFELNITNNSTEQNCSESISNVNKNN